MPSYTLKATEVAFVTEKEAKEASRATLAAHHQTAVDKANTAKTAGTAAAQASYKQLLLDASQADPGAAAITVDKDGDGVPTGLTWA